MTPTGQRQRHAAAGRADTAAVSGRLPLALAVLLSAVLPVRAAVVSSVFSGRLPCVERDGVQFCEGSLAARVESWDGVPLDVNVTLPPAAMDGPFPLIVDLHGWSAGKNAAPSVQRALAGYVVVSYSARGFHQSCGFAVARLPDPGLATPGVCAERGWVHLADARYEARDTQHLAGLLADEGLVVPDRVGVTGVSYGGGQSFILAALRNRTMLPDGALVPWRSPGGLDMAIAAAAPIVPWTDLAEALTPSGRTLDYRIENPFPARPGVQKQSYTELLYGSGAATGFYAPAGADPDADLTAWNARLAAGEPYDDDPLLAHVRDEITAHHSAYYVDDSIAPAPLFVYNAWTDDLFPVDEALRFWRRTRARHPGAEIALHFADTFGHPRAALAGDVARVFVRVEQFLARHLKGVGAPLPGVEAYTQACGGAAEAGPFTAADWDALRPGEVRFRAAVRRVVTSAGGNPETAAALDPLQGGPCRTLPATDDPGEGTYRFPPASGAGYTLMGAPTLIASLTVAGSYAQLVARLWDVAPDGTQRLVTHQPYRPRTDNLGPQVLQLHGNGWHFAAGHAPKLELLGQSPPFVRASSGTFHVTVRDIELRLPVLEAPDGVTVLAPLPAVMPPDAPEPPDVGPPACGPAPEEGCQPGGGVLRMPRDTLVWGWRKGTATTTALGDPRATTAYRLCVYDAASALAASAAVPAGGECAGRHRTRECWERTPGGFRYANPAGAPDGVQRLVLKPSRRPGRAAISLRAAGLAVPSGEVRLQLRNGPGGCWEGTYTVR